MSTPAVFLERWGAAGVEATVPAGAAGLPVAIPGNAENWVMAGGWAGFPAADSISDSTLPRLFRIFDPDDPREIMRVRQTSGSAWLVVRGDQGTLPVAHDPGFTVRPFITAAGLGALARAVPPRRGLVVAPPQTPASTGPRSQAAAGTGVTARPEQDPRRGADPRGGGNRGCTYEAMASGRYTAGPATPATGSPHIDCGLFYGGFGGEVGQLSRPLFGVRPTAARFRLHAVRSLPRHVSPPSPSTWRLPRTSARRSSSACSARRPRSSPRTPATG